MALEGGVHLVDARALTGIQRSVDRAEPEEVAVWVVACWWPGPTPTERAETIAAGRATLG